MKRKTTKGQFLLILFGAFLLTCCFFGASYALNNSVSPTSEFNYFATDDLELSYVDSGKGESDVLSLVEPSFKTEEEARKEEGYRFSVSNLSHSEKKYRLRLIEDYGILAEEDCLYKELPFTDIYVQFDNQPPTRLVDLESHGYLLYESSDTILPGNSEIHELRIWVKEGSPLSDNTKHYHGKILLEEVTDSYPSYKKGDLLTIGHSSYVVLEDSDVNNGFLRLMPTASFTYEGLPCDGTNCFMATEENLFEILENQQIQLENAIGEIFDFSVFHQRLLTVEEWSKYQGDPLLASILSNRYWKYDASLGQSVSLDSSSGEVRSVILLYKGLLKDPENQE